MENVAKKLKFCNKGTELYSTIFGVVFFDSLSKNGSTIYVRTKKDSKIKKFNKYGVYKNGYEDTGEMSLFPQYPFKSWKDVLPINDNHPVMVSERGDLWIFKKFNIDLINDYKYIVPVEDFNFYATSIESNCNSNISPNFSEK